MNEMRKIMEALDTINENRFDSEVAAEKAISMLASIIVADIISAVKRRGPTALGNESLIHHEISKITKELDKRVRDSYNDEMD